MEALQDIPMIYCLPEPAELKVSFEGNQMLEIIIVLWFLVKKNVSIP